MTIYLKPSTPEQSSSEIIRSSTTNRVLGRLGKDGLYFWERLSKIQYVFSWEDILHAYQHYHVSNSEDSCIPEEKSTAKVGLD